MIYSRTLIPICSLLAAAVLALAQSPAPTPAAMPAPPEVWEQAPTPRAMPAPRPVRPMLAARAAEEWDQTPTPPAPPAPPAPAAMPAPRAVRPMLAARAAEEWDQTPTPPVPPAPPAPAAMPAPPMPPMPPMPAMDFDLDAPMAMAAQMRYKFELDFDLQDQIQSAKEMAARARIDADEVREQAMMAVRDSMSGMKFAFAAQAGQSAGAGVSYGGKMPTAASAQAGMRRLANMSDDQAYSSGQRSLESGQWEDAIAYFNQVVSRSGTRADGAVYWKAYALGKLGRRDEGLAAIAELRKSFAGSRWLDDAKALELELKQASGQPVSPDSQSDEELKLMAINGLMQNDPERAMPLLEKQLKGSASPRVKRNALFVLAQSSSPKAQTMIEQIARGGANPDLQVKAIMYMTERRRTGNAQILSEIYASTTDIAVKRAILQAYMNNKDKDRLLQAAKTEKAPELREVAISYLGETQGNPELWQLYAAETTPEGKIQLLRYMHSNSNSDKLLEVVRNEKDSKVRIAAMQALASQRSGAVNGEALVSIYNAEQDQQMKQRILDSLMGQRNAKALVEIARQEKDQKLKLRIVERLANMKDKEAQDYLQEILSK